MITYILRLAEVPNGLRGTVETPGGERCRFRSAEELVEILSRETARNEEERQPGYDSGSTSSSPIRET